MSDVEGVHLKRRKETEVYYISDEDDNYNDGDDEDEEMPGESKTEKMILLFLLLSHSVQL